VQIHLFEIVFVHPSSSSPIVRNNQGSIFIPFKSHLNPGTFQYGGYQIADYEGDVTGLSQPSQLHGLFTIKGSRQSINDLIRKHSNLFQQ